MSWIQNNNIIAFPYGWQYPAKTEQHAYEKILESFPHHPDIAYIGFPWATLIDYINNNPIKAAPYIDKLKQIPSGSHVVKITVVQHIDSDQIFNILKAIGITDLFWSHAKKEQNCIDGIRIHPFPLFPVRCLDDPTFSPKPLHERKYIYSFVGAYDPGCYLTDTRHLLTQMEHPPDAAIISRGIEWHFKSDVYDLQVFDCAASVDKAYQLENNAVVYNAVLSESVFSLCPSGSGPNSIRLWESLGFGCIPVILADTLRLPGDPDLWQQAAVFVKEDKASLDGMESRLREIASNPSLLTKYREAGEKLWDLYGTENFVHNILQYVNDITDNKIAYGHFINKAKLNNEYSNSDNNVSLKHENPIISVIVTTYASEAFMRECLDDLVNQTIFNQIEIVIVDAASPENERAIIEEYQQHYNNIRYIRTPERITVYAAWNLAIKEARGTYITTFSTNDRLAPYACEVLKTALESNPDAALVYGDTYLTATPHETFDNHTLIGSYEWADYSFISLLTTCLVGPHPMWRKWVHDTIGYFDDKYLALGDQEFWLRMGEQFKLLHIKVFTGLYWVDDNALSQREANEINSIRAIYQNRHAALLHAFTTPKVSIIIPLYNQVNFTANCLEKLFMHTFASQYELILVDNGSTDRTEELLAVLPSTVKIIRNKENLGFAKASNQGAAVAKGKYLLFLNNDTEPLEDWLKPLVKILDTDPAVAAVGSKLLYADNTLQHAGVLVFNHYSTKNLLRLNHIYMGEPSDLPSANIACHYQVITGACLMVRKEAFEAVGGFDEQYWNGFEDVELCFKLGQAGWKLVYEPKSVLYHFESKSGPERFVKEAENTNLLRSRWQGLIKPDLVIHEGDSSTCISGFPCEYKRKGYV